MYSKGTIKKMKIQFRDWETIFVKCIFHKGVLSCIYKEHKPNKKMNDPIENGQKI